MSSASPDTGPSFSDLALSKPVLEALDEVGYEQPTPIQAQCIPELLAGRDLVGQAQTGTGKTAAFALPFLSRLDPSKKLPQLMVLTPTRELAIQVAEAFQRYASKMRNFRVLPVYGGQAYEGQIRQLRRGVDVIVGTPGRVMDHMRKGTLDLSELAGLVLDEADEMLQMGFLEDVKWVLERTPDTRQIALFSATMPAPIKRVAQQHLKDPAEIRTKTRQATADTIRQRFWIASGRHKLDTLTRILETEEYDGIIIFVRTKTATVELAERLEARGFAAAALNGDVPQAQRERTVDRLKKSKLDLLVATDVAARGLDVERVSHVINYDMPHDVESYVHRIGRTGRAGRQGDAILFVAPRERRMLKSIEHAVGRPLESLKIPSPAEVNDQRIKRFKERITAAFEAKDIEFYQSLISEMAQESGEPAERIAAALASMVQGDRPLLLPNVTEPEPKFRESRDRGFESKPRFGRDKRHRDGGEPRRDTRPGHKNRAAKPVEAGMKRYRIEVGKQHGARPGNIVGAMTHEGGLKAGDIGRIDLYDQFSLVDLKDSVEGETLQRIGRAWVRGRKLRIRHV